MEAGESMIRQRPTVTKTNAYTTTDADDGYRIICNSASPFTVSLHTATGRYNFDLEIDNIGAGVVTVGSQTLAQYAHAHVGNNGGTAWTVVVSGGGGGAVAAEDVSYDNTTTEMTATDAQAAIDELFTSVSDGKTLVAAAITDKGVETAATDSFTTMADNIANISGGASILTGDAVAGNVLSGKTFYSNDPDTKLTGTMTNNGANNVEVTDVDGTVISAGYYNGSGSAVLSSTEAAKVVAENIKSGITLLGVSGSYTGGGTYQSKTVTPDMAGQTVTPDAGYDALSQVTIGGDADLSAANIKKDVVVFGVTGTYEGAEALINYYEKLAPQNNLNFSFSYVIT